MGGPVLLANPVLEVQSGILGFKSRFARQLFLMPATGSSLKAPPPLYQPKSKTSPVKLDAVGSTKRANCTLQIAETQKGIRIWEVFPTNDSLVTFLDDS